MTVLPCERPDSGDGAALPPDTDTLEKTKKRKNVRDLPRNGREQKIGNVEGTGEPVLPACRHVSLPVGHEGLREKTAGS